MTKDEALLMALEALEGNTTNPVIDPDQAAIEDQAIAAIKQALAAPVQGYVTGLDVYLDPADMKPKRYPPAQPAPVQEPVGYVAENGVVDWNVCAPPILTDLYTTPPAQPAPVQEPGTLNIDRLGQWLDASLKERAAQRQWVGLEEKEIDKLKHLIDWTATWSHGRFAYEIEQLLKEKNA